MLVMARKVGERIQVGENVMIKVLAIEKGRIRIGIEAPREIGVMRSERLCEAENQFHVDEVCQSPC